MTIENEIIELENKLFPRRKFIKPSINQHYFITMEERLENLKNLYKNQEKQDENSNFERGCYIMMWAELRHV